MLVCRLEGGAGAETDVVLGGSVCCYFGTIPAKLLARRSWLRVAWALCQWIRASRTQARVASEKFTKAAASLGVDPTNAGKGATKAVAKAAKGGSKTLVGQAQAAADPGELASRVFGAPWFPAAGLVVTGLAAAALLVWWKKKRGAARVASEWQATRWDALEDYRQFLSKLPRRMRRVRDDFAPVIVLGNVASEKARIISSFSGVEQNQRLFPGKVSHSGRAVELHLGARCLLVVPSEQFLAADSSSEDPTWRKLMERLCRVRAPRVVVCLSQASVDSGDQEAIAQWVGGLRAHVDAVAELRDEPLSVTVVLAQSPPSRGTGARLSDGFFELVAALGQSGRYEQLLHVPLAGIAASIGTGEEQRKYDGQRWIAERLIECQRGFPRLLGQPDRSARKILELAGLFERFDSITGTLGVALSELFFSAPGGASPVRPETLSFLPFQGGRFVVPLGVFDGPLREEGEQWHPSGRLIHRAVVASVAALATLAMGYWHASDRQDWLAAARVVRDYDPGVPDQQIHIVEDYFKHRRRSVLPGFYDRDRLRCRIVRLVRERLEGKIRSALRSGSPPETVLQLVSLYVTGAPNDCAIERGRYGLYERLSQTIETYIDQWRRATEMRDEEIRAYLLLSCPKATFQLEALDQFQRQMEGQLDEGDALPDATAFGRNLQSLSGQCPPTLADEEALRRAEVVASQLAMRHNDSAGALAVLEAMQRVPDPVMRRLVDVFKPYEERLSKLRDLGNERADLMRLARDVGAFSGEAHDARPARPETLQSFAARAKATLEPVDLEEARVRLNLQGERYTIDRSQVRGALQRVAFDRQSQAFVQGQAGALAPGDLLFGSERRRPYQWASPASGRSVQVRAEVAYRYTLEGFRRVARPALLDYGLVRQRAACAAPGGQEPSTAHLAALDDFLQRRVESYLLGYNEQWLSVYRSFDMSALVGASDAELAAALEELTRPHSQLVSLLQEVSRQVRLATDDPLPFADSLWMAERDLETLHEAVEPKALSEYLALLGVLVEAVQAPRAALAPALAEAGADQLSRSMDQPWRGSLSRFGVLVVDSLEDPTKDLRTLLGAWGEALGLTAEQLAPLAEPFRVAYAQGQADVQRATERWWKTETQKLRRDVLSRFPFQRGSREDAKVPTVRAWLEPVEGRFSRSLQSTLRLLAPCPGCLPTADEPQRLTRRVRDIQAALFDEAGQPKQLLLRLQPVPFAEAGTGRPGPHPKAAVLHAAGLRHTYYNTEPRAETLQLPWAEAYVSQLEVELAGESAARSLQPLSTPKSAWSFLHLLRQASAQGGRYTWQLDSTAPSAAGPIAVSYEVCEETSHCGRLLSEVFAWR